MGMQIAKDAQQLLDVLRNQYDVAEKNFKSVMMDHIDLMERADPIFVFQHTYDKRRYRVAFYARTQFADKQFQCAAPAEVTYICQITDIKTGKSLVAMFAFDGREDIDYTGQKYAVSLETKLMTMMCLAAEEMWMTYIIWLIKDFVHQDKNTWHESAQFYRILD